MALKKLPGGVVVETDGGARLNEDAGVNLEAIHRQLGVQPTGFTGSGVRVVHAALYRADLHDPLDPTKP